MKKFAIVLFTAAMTLGSGVAMAASGNNGTANQAADAGAKAGGANENLAPNKVDNSKINTGDTSGSATDHNKMSADEMHKNSQCKDGKCPDVNKKVETGTGTDVNTKTDGTTQ